MPGSPRARGSLLSSTCDPAVFENRAERLAQRLRGQGESSVLRGRLTQYYVTQKQGAKRQRPTNLPQA